MHVLVHYAKLTCHRICKPLLIRHFRSHFKLNVSEVGLYSFADMLKTHFVCYVIATVDTVKPVFTST